ncbi:uncharacterized protein LOC129576066 [Sitodiplosis mosellana]|uniref:uncharacterized protein LOC129576066 n=1 Tax=Sitodiplosis mosellana TaxID=263140 RepID=UPI002443904C|nr:uncharacterized protein LOC129576066 [Sitodiplosis mosellana]
MPKASSDKLREIFKNDGYTYVVKSIDSERIDANYPNIPYWHISVGEECVRSDFPDATVICFEYRGSHYKLVSNWGIPDCNDGCFGALFDGNNDKILDLLSTGDVETTIRSQKNADTTLDDDFSTKLRPYLKFFTIVLENTTEFEYLAFKVLAENRRLYDIDEIDNPAVYNSDYDTPDDDEEEYGEGEVEEEDERGEEEIEEIEKKEFHR